MVDEQLALVSVVCPILLLGVLISEGEAVARMTLTGADMMS